MLKIAFCELSFFIEKTTNICHSHRNFRNKNKSNPLLEVQILYDPSCPLVGRLTGWLVGRLVGRSYFPKRVQSHIYAPIGARVSLPN